MPPLFPLSFSVHVPASSSSLISFMASSSSSNLNNYTTTNITNVSSPSTSFSPTFDPNLSTNTTFVQADPTTFRDVVQKLTGAPHNLATPKLPVTFPDRMGPRRSAFKLHERRQTARKLEIKLNNNGGSPIGSPGTRQRSFLGFGGEMVMVSPVSPLDLLSRGSPRTPHSPIEVEEKAIAEKGFYLHPSPLSTPRGSEPKLLPLFPLHSPRDNSSAP